MFRMPEPHQILVPSTWEERLDRYTVSTLAGVVGKLRPEADKTQSLREPSAHRGEDTTRPAQATNRGGWQMRDRDSALGIH